MYVNFFLLTISFKYFPHWPSSKSFFSKAIFDIDRLGIKPFDVDLFYKWNLKNIQFQAKLSFLTA